MARRPPPVDYVERTRSLPVNLLFLMPLVLVYEGALLATRSPLENAAASWMRAALEALGPRLFTALSLAFCVVLVLAVLLRCREAARDRGVYGGMLLEGLAYGLLLGLVAEALSRTLPLERGLSWGAPGAGSTVAMLRTRLETLALAVGAGVFEELLFRGVLMAGLAALLHAVLGLPRLAALVVAVLASSYVFSDYHHWGAGGEPYDARVFAFRFHAGVVLGTIYATRGLGIAAFAHGIYDVVVLFGR